MARGPAALHPRGFKEVCPLSASVIQVVTYGSPASRASLTLAILCALD